MGRPTKYKGEAMQSVHLRIDPVLLHSLGTLYNIDKRTGIEGTGSFSIWLRTLMYREVEQRKELIAKYRELITENVGKGK